MKIRSKQAVYLGADRKTVFPENHPEAAFLLVGAGSEIEEAELEKYPGADKLVNTAAKPYTTVTDSKVVGGKVVEGSTVKVDPNASDAPAAVPNENPANADVAAAPSATKTAAPAAKSSAKKSTRK